MRARASAPRVSLKSGLIRFIAIFKYIVRTCTSYIREHNTHNLIFKKAANWDKLLTMARTSSNNSLRDNFAIAGHQAAFPLTIVLSDEQRAKVSHAITLLRKGIGPRRTLADVRNACAQHTPPIFNVPRRVLNTASCHIYSTVTRRSRAPFEGVLPQYDKRVVYCRLCNAPNDATTIQLWYVKGFRSLHCNECKAYFSTFNALCQCDDVWHSCLIHRIDPATHIPRRGWKRKFSSASANASPNGEEVVDYPHRQAPAASEGSQWLINTNLPQRRVYLNKTINPILAKRFPHLVKPD